MSFKDKIDLNKLPKHVAIIMDGNGRWAKQRGFERIIGHEHAIVPVRETAEAAAELGIKYLTLYAFSTENWKRPIDEVNALMSLLVKTINKETETLNKNNIRLLAIGNLKSLHEESYTELMQAINETANNTRMSLVLALSYGSRWEIVNAVQEIIRNYELGKRNKGALSKAEDIDEEVFSNYLTTRGIPDPELMIRTSNEYRISNFLLWQLAYAELYFSAKLWPDFTKEDFYEAILNFQNRERRFGLTSEQIK